MRPRRRDLVGDFGGWCGDHARAGPHRSCAREHRELHAEASRRQDLEFALRARRGAQAGDRLVRGLCGVHQDVDAARSGRSAHGDGRGLRANHGSRPPLRGHGEPVHRRRRHGAVRRAHRPRGSRGARGGGGALGAEGDPRVRRDAAPEPGTRLRPPYRHQHRPRRRRPHRRRPPHGLHRAGGDGESRRASAGGRRRGRGADQRGDGSPRERVLRHHRCGATDRQGDRPSGGRVHGPRAATSARALRGGHRAWIDPPRGSHARPGAPHRIRRSCAERARAGHLRRRRRRRRQVTAPLRAQTAPPRSTRAVSRRPLPAAWRGAAVPSRRAVPAGELRTRRR